MAFKFKPLAAAVLFAAFSVQAFAATKTLDGDHFTITYDEAVIGLFGAPSLVNSSLVFGNIGGSPGFAAQTASGIKFTNSTFAFTITADQGYKLSGFNLFEAGDYAVIGGDSAVLVGGQLRVKPVGVSAMTSQITATAPLSAKTSFLSYATTDWEAHASVVPATALTSATVSIENILGAYVPAAGYAFIEKKNVELGFMLSAVPEPESYAMLLAGLGMMMTVVSRRRNKRS
jgi:hypothetical protein